MKKLALTLFTISLLTQSTLVFAQVPATDLSYGTTGTVVKELQTTLKSLGFFTEEVTGNFFSKTRAAVKQLQLSLGVKATGYFGAKTRMALQSSGLLTGIPRSALTAQVAGASGLVAAYSFDEGGGTTLTDRSGSGNNGTLVNGPTWTTGKYGGGLQFNGAGSYVSIPDASSLNLSSMSLSTWIKPMSVTGNPIIMRKGWSATQSWLYNYRLTTLGSGVRWTYSGGNYQDTPSGVLSAGIWQHVAMTYDATSFVIKIYVNGVLQYIGSEPNVPGAISGILMLGGSPTTGENFSGASKL